MITLALVICLVGLLIYLLAKPETRGGRVVRAGEIAYFVGLAGVVWTVGAKVLA